MSDEEDLVDEEELIDLEEADLQPEIGADVDAEHETEKIESEIDKWYRNKLSTEEIQTYLESLPDESLSFQTLSWYGLDLEKIDEGNDEVKELETEYIIFIHGVTLLEYICLKVNEFVPFFYVEVDK